jgi:hypothetical protein
MMFGFDIYYSTREKQNQQLRSFFFAFCFHFISFCEGNKLKFSFLTFCYTRMCVCISILSLFFAPHFAKIEIRFFVVKSPGANFTNILRAPFSCKSFVRSFFVLEVKVKLFICARILAQLRQ